MRIFDYSWECLCVALCVCDEHVPHFFNDGDRQTLFQWNKGVVSRQQRLKTMLFQGQEKFWKIIMLENQHGFLNIWFMVWNGSQWVKVWEFNGKKRHTYHITLWFETGHGHEAQSLQWFVGGRLHSSQNFAECCGWGLKHGLSRVLLPANINNYCNGFTFGIYRYSKWHALLADKDLENLMRHQEVQVSVTFTQHGDRGAMGF